MVTGGSSGRGDSDWSRRQALLRRMGLGNPSHEDVSRQNGHIHPSQTDQGSSAARPVPDAIKPTRPKANAAPRPAGSVPPAIQSRRSVSQSRDGDQFLTEQPPGTPVPPGIPETPAPESTSASGKLIGGVLGSVPRNPAEDPSGASRENSGGTFRGDSGGTSGGGPRLRLVGTETDGAADGGAQPLPLGMVKSKSPEARASSSASTTTAARGRHGHSGSKADRERRSGLRPGPFGLSDGRSGTITGSGVMVDLAPVGQPIDQATDPRWVLAVRTAEALQGSILPPDKREQLLRLGKVMGMTAFDANLVIAIVQDQARRGYAPEYCPTAGELQLQMVPKPGSGGKLRQFVPGRGALKVACAIAAVLAAEIIFVHWWLG